MIAFDLRKMASSHFQIMTILLLGISLSNFAIYFAFFSQALINFGKLIAKIYQVDQWGCNYCYYHYIIHIGEQST